MESRLKLHEILKSLCDHVYFQPPDKARIEYPCIIYFLNRQTTDYANDSHYRDYDQYQLTVIDRNPDSELVKEVRKLTYCSFVRYFTSDNLNHYVYNIYF